MPQIKRHLYIDDERFYTLIPRFDDSTIDNFSKSKCIQTDENEHYVTFSGQLEGNQDCHIHRKVEFDGENLYDVYSGSVGYDDLYDYSGVR